MRQKIWMWAGVAVFGSLTLVACSKDGEVEENTSSTTASWPGAELGLDEELFKELMHPMGGKMMHHTPCEGRNHHMKMMEGDEEEGFPRTKVIDFSKMEGKSAKMMKGREAPSGTLTVEVSADPKEEGAVRKMTFADFGREDRTMNGTLMVTNTGQNEQGNWVYAMVADMTCSGEKGSSSRKFSGTHEWAEGFETEDCDDNVILMSGSSSGTLPGGEQFTKEITSPLRMDASCKMITSGVLEIEVDGQDITVDFGDGSCDREIEVTVDGASTTITVPERPERGEDCERGGRRGRGHRHN